MDRLSNRTNNEQLELPPPPPYTTVVYKSDELNRSINSLPAYTEVDNQSAVYANNYSDPPLTDGCVEITSEVPSMNYGNLTSNTVRIYILINGIITILLSLAAVGLQIGILTSHAITYYYYGFWAGAFLICIGINTIFLYRHHSQKTYSNIFHAFFWQMILVGVIFGIGIIIILTDKCDDNNTDDGGIKDPACRSSYKTLNGFLIGIFAVGFAQSIINTFIFGASKKYFSGILNFTS